MFQFLSSKKKGLPSTTFTKSSRGGLPSTTFTKNKSGAGFTLVELIVAIFILGIAVTAVLGIFPLGLQIVRFSETATVATHLANAKIEEVISTPYKEISLGFVTELALPAPFQGYTRETRVSYVDPSLDFQESGVDTDIKKIEVTVFWRSSLKINKKNIKITTLISKK